jgi:hypothetical protein
VRRHKGTKGAWLASHAGGPDAARQEGSRGGGHLLGEKVQTPRSDYRHEMPTINGTHTSALVVHSY